MSSIVAMLLMSQKYDVFCEYWVKARARKAIMGHWSKLQAGDARDCTYGLAGGACALAPQCVHHACATRTTCTHAKTHASTTLTTQYAHTCTCSCTHMHVYLHTHAHPCSCRDRGAPVIRRCCYCGIPCRPACAPLPLTHYTFECTAAPCTMGPGLPTHATPGAAPG